MSCSIALRRSPKPGALTATALTVLRIELTTSVDSASPSTSSATTTSGLPACATFSSSGRNSVSAPTLPDTSSTAASSWTASMRSASVTKYGLM